jgi:hypothetical protein
LGELTDHDDDDYDPDGQFESAYLRFREAFVGNKYQLRKMTFSKYLDLHGEAFKSAAAARLANSALPQHTLSEVQLAALRASNPPGFSVDHPAYLFFRAQPESFEKPADLAPSLSDTVVSDTVDRVELDLLDKADRRQEAVAISKANSIQTTSAASPCSATPG